jgi:hypothetical protein
MIGGCPCGAIRHEIADGPPHLLGSHWELGDPDRRKPKE